MHEGALEEGKEEQVIEPQEQGENKGAVAGARSSFGQKECVESKEREEDEEPFHVGERAEDRAHAHEVRTPWNLGEVIEVDLFDE